LVDFRTEDQDDMCKRHQVRWTIIPKSEPQPWIACSGCGGLAPFRCSGKVRLNANGRRLDAWLIYKCTGCAKTWNRPLFERRNVRDIDPGVLDALQSNDPSWIRRQMFDLDALRRSSPRIDEFADCDVRREVLFEDPAWTQLEIDLRVPYPACLRLDRLLAAELGLSRSRLRLMVDSGRLRTEPSRADSLRRRIRDAMRVIVDRSDRDDIMIVGARS
jgi:hypothetical protein